MVEGSISLWFGPRGELVHTTSLTRSCPAVVPPIQHLEARASSESRSPARQLQHATGSPGPPVPRHARTASTLAKQASDPRSPADAQPALVGSGALQVGNSDAVGVRPGEAEVLDPKPSAAHASTMQLESCLCTAGPARSPWRSKEARP